MKVTFRKPVLAGFVSIVILNSSFLNVAYMFFHNLSSFGPLDGLHLVRHPYINQHYLRMNEYRINKKYYEKPLRSVTLFNENIFYYRFGKNILKQAIMVVCLYNLRDRTYSQVYT